MVHPNSKKLNEIKFLHMSLAILPLHIDIGQLGILCDHVVYLVI